MSVAEVQIQQIFTELLLHVKYKTPTSWNIQFGDEQRRYSQGVIITEH